MACNTIHLFRKVLQKQVNASILDLQAAIGKKIKEKTLVLGSPIACKRLYNFPNTIIPSDSELKELGTAIFLFNKGVKKEEQKEKVLKICKNHDFNAILLGCTEIALMLKGYQNTIDSIDVLAELIVEKLSNKKYR
jgi:aspartate/glutamate racemase